MKKSLLLCSGLALLLASSVGYGAIFVASNVATNVMCDIFVTGQPVFGFVLVPYGNVTFPCMSGLTGSVVFHPVVQTASFLPLTNTLSDGGSYLYGGTASFYTPTVVQPDTQTVLVTNYDFVNNTNTISVSTPATWSTEDLTQPYVAGFGSGLTMFGFGWIYRLMTRKLGDSIGRDY